MIRRCAARGCPHLVRWAATCPAHRTSTDPGSDLDVNVTTACLNRRPVERRAHEAGPLPASDAPCVRSHPANATPYHPREGEADHR